MENVAIWQECKGQQMKRKKKNTVAWIVLLTGLGLIDDRVSRAMAAKMGIY